MPTLYVTQPLATVRKSGGSLVVTYQEDPDGAGPLPERRKTLIEVEPHRLEMIALVGSAHITSNALHLCLRKGIAVAWFQWNGKLLGRIVPAEATCSDLRLRQYGAWHDADSRLARAKSVVAAKITNAGEVLKEIQSNYPGEESVAHAIAELRRQWQATQDCSAADQLLGMEGNAARAYFQALRTAFRADIPFESRRQHPSPDPANALLSFGYVLLGNRLAGLLEARGLDPAIGFFHKVRPGRPSLALDLLEELRHPVVDRFVLRACNLRILRPEMFEPDADRPGGVRMIRDGMRRFFREWASFWQRPLREQGAAARPTPGEVLRRQVDRLAADLRGTAAYEPFHYGG